MTPDLDVRPLPITCPRWQRVSLSAIAFFLLALAGLAVSRYPGNVAMLWLANAFGLGILLHQRSGDTPWQLAGMLVAGVAANAAMGDNPAIALALALGNVAEIAFS